MIRKSELESFPHNPHALVMDILEHNQEYYMTRDEIYEQLPKVEHERAITYGQMCTALKELTKFGHINATYVKGRAYYGYTERPNGRCCY